MQTVVQFPGNLSAVEDLPSLRQVSTTTLPSKDSYLVQGRNEFGDKLGGIFAWDPALTDADDNARVIRPADRTPLQAGRWVATVSGTGADGPGTVVATLAALKSSDIGNIALIYNGFVYSWTAGDYTGLADDTNIVESDNTPIDEGAWVRANPLPFTSLLDHYLPEDDDDYSPAMGRAIDAAVYVDVPERAAGYDFRTPVVTTLVNNTTINFRGQECRHHRTAQITLSAAVVASGLTLAANAARYAVTLTLSNGAGVQEGDLIYINTNILPSPEWGDTKRDLVRVRSMAGAVATLEAGLNFPYATADAGLTIVVYRPVSLEMINPTLKFIGTAAGYGVNESTIAYRLESLVDCVITRPTLKAERPFDRTANIFRVPIWIERCWNTTINDANTDSVSYTFGIYSGSRFTFENSTQSRYCRHAHADVGGWSSDYFVDGLQAVDNLASISTHPSFRVHVARANVVNDANACNMRTFGGSIRSSTLNNNGPQESSQYQSILVNAGFEYLYQDADFTLDGVTYKYPNFVSSSPFKLSYGRTLRVRDTDVFTIEAGADYGKVTEVILGAGNKASVGNGTSTYKPGIKAPVRGAPSLLPADTFAANSYKIDTFFNLAEQTTDSLRCYGPVVRGLTGASPIIAVRINTNGFATIAMPDVVEGDLTLWVTMRHGTNLVSRIGKTWHFMQRVKATSALTFSTTPIWTSDLTGQLATIVLGGSGALGETALGAGNQDYYVEAAFTLGSTAATDPVFSINYELDLRRAVL